MRKDYDAKRTVRTRGPSATRLRIDRLKAFVPNLLETNIFTTPSTRMGNMPASNIKAFDLLLTAFRPRVIIAHGVNSAKNLAGWTGGEFIACRYLSRAGYAVVDEIDGKLRDR